MRQATDTTPKELLFAALQEHPTKVMIGVPQVMHAARRNDKRPAFAKIALPDQVVRSITGADEKRGVLLAVWVSRDVLDEMASPIVRP